MTANIESCSAILFCYNEASYIEKSIHSLLSQSVPFSEIIVVDDYSTDTTPELINQLSFKFPQIKYVLNQYAKGKVHAYQTGLERVKSEYFFVMGSDDEAMPNLVELSLQRIQQLKVPFFFHSSTFIDEKSYDISGQFISSFDPRSCFIYNKTGAFIFGHTDIIPLIIPFPIGLEFEDWYTVLCLYEKFGNVNTCQTPLIRYRIHSQSDSQASRWDWERRQHLLQRDIRFLSLISEQLPGLGKLRAKESLMFRTRLLRSLPMLGHNMHTTKLFVKTYLSFLLSRLISYIR